MISRLMTGIVTLLFVVSGVALASPRPVAAANPFTDLGGSLFQADIDWAFTNSITTGCTPTAYCPDGLVTREQMASFLVRMFGLPATAGDFFTDDEASLHENDINRLAASGITSGCAPELFCPSQAVTREEMASFLARATATSAGGGNNYFYDDNGRSHEVNIDRIAAAGIGNGCAQWEFCPTGTVSRGQMAAFLHRVDAPISAPPFPAPPPPAPSAPPTSNCHASYTGACLLIGIGDYDCLGGSGNGPNYVAGPVYVVGYDEFGLDADSDGIGCET